MFNAFPPFNPIGYAFSIDIWTTLDIYLDYFGSSHARFSIYKCIFLKSFDSKSGFPFLSGDFFKKISWGLRKAIFPWTSRDLREPQHVCRWDFYSLVIAYGLFGIIQSLTTIWFIYWRDILIVHYLAKTRGRFETDQQRCHKPAFWASTAQKVEKGVRMLLKALCHQITEMLRF